MSTATSTVSLRADISQLVKSMKEIPGITEGEAKRMAIALEKQFKNAEKAAKEAAGASKAAMGKFKTAAEEAAESTKALGSAAGDTESGLRAVAGVLGIVSPELERAISTVAEFGGGLEGATKLSGRFGVSLRAVLMVLGPIGLAVGAAAAAYAIYSREIETANQVQATYAAQAKALEATERKITDQRLLLAKATGQITDAELRRAQASLTAQRAVMEFAEAQVAERKELRATEERWGALGDGLKLVAERGDALAAGTAQVVDAIVGASEKTDAARERTAALNQALEKEAALQKELRGLMEETSGAMERAAAGKRDSTDASRDEAAAAQEAARAYADAIRTRESALGELRAMQLDAVGAMLSEEERLQQAYQLDLDKIAKLEAATWELAGAEEARAARAVQFESDIAELRDRQAAEQAQRTEEAARQAAQVAQAQMQAVQQVGGYVQQGIGMLSDSLSDSYEAAADVADRLEQRLIEGEDFYTASQKAALSKRVEAQREAAKKAWNAAKSAKIAEAMASTALAAINAIAQSPPPSPFGLIGAGIATAAGMASVAAIQGQQPVFDTGGPISPDHRMVTAQPGEWISSKVGRSKLGDETLKRADAGISPQAQVYAVSVYRHDRIVTRWEDDRLKLGGPTDQAIRSSLRSTGSIYGHRAR